MAETVSAQVIAANGQPVNQGTVTFNDGGLLASVPVQGGLATYTFDKESLAQGHAVSATYTSPSLFGDISASSERYPPAAPPLMQALLDLQMCNADFFANLIP